VPGDSVGGPLGAIAQTIDHQFEQRLRARTWQPLERVDADADESAHQIKVVDPRRLREVVLQRLIDRLVGIVVVRTGTRNA
jgi:hypothetical protein